MERADELEERPAAAVDPPAEAGEHAPPGEPRGGVGERPVARAADLVDGVVTAVVAVDVVTDLIEAIPAIAGESMEVLGNIGEALGDVLDFDF